MKQNINSSYLTTVCWTLNRLIPTSKRMGLNVGSTDHYSQRCLPNTTEVKQINPSSSNQLSFGQ